MDARKIAITFVTVVALALPACGGSGEERGGSTGAQPTAEAQTGATGATDGATTGSAGSTGSTSPDEIDADGEVPDPCTLLSPAELTDLLASDPGTGTVQTGDPNERKVCFYGSGLILAVEVAEHWDASVELVRASELGSVKEVAGVGEVAVWQDVGGGSGQFLALGADYFVGVTVVTGGPDVAADVAAAMLAEI